MRTCMNHYRVRTLSPSQSSTFRVPVASAARVVLSIATAVIAATVLHIGGFEYGQWR